MYMDNKNFHGRQSVEAMEAYLNDIIPGLPGDLALECLVRVPSARLHKLREVSKSWNRASEDEQQPVLVYDFSEGKWREGTPMPGLTRYNFFCGTDGIGTIFIAGGTHYFGQYLPSTRAYDVESDEWISLPVIWPSQSSTHVPFHGLKFHQVHIGNRALDFMTSLAWRVEEGEYIKYKYDPQRYWVSPRQFSPSDWKEIVRFMEQQFGGATPTTHPSALQSHSLEKQTSHNDRIPPLEYPTSIRGYCIVPFLSEKIVVWD
ncbi:hypothetical protein H6P81_008360 [Aristolochia fimbriata]|uniref:F-box domain-containing protein n=1 Tax=Aristolochia fimbriata TaxID=158543 RepID=A0AAV7F5Q2_ARIFI|nr:hypothetical protein H6P81_008360 [Aristolochia fimbriata]